MADIYEIHLRGNCQGRTLKKMCEQDGRGIACPSARGKKQEKREKETRSAFRFSAANGFEQMSLSAESSGASRSGGWQVAVACGRGCGLLTTSELDPPTNQ